MAYFVSRADEAPLDPDRVVSILSADQSIVQWELVSTVSNLKGTCEFRSRMDQIAEVRVFTALISIEGDEDAILEFALWFQSQYDLPLIFGHPAAPAEIELTSIQTVEDLQSAMEEEWG